MVMASVSGPQILTSGKESCSFIFGVIMLKKRLEVKRAMQAGVFLMEYLNFAAGIVARR